MRIYIIGLVILALLGSVGTAINSYMSLQRDLNNALTKVSVLKNNIKVQKLMYEDKMAKAVSGAVNKLKRDAIMKEMSYDHSKSVDIKSTKYYIAY